ncbi:sugar transferase [Methylomagnum sp.]
MEGINNEACVSFGDIPQSESNTRRNYSTRMGQTHGRSTHQNRWIYGVINKPSVPARIKAYSDIKNIIIHERIRADRNHHGFSLLIFEIDNQADNPDANLSNSVPLERIRSTDFVGHFHKNRLALVLPYTKREEAQILAREMVGLAYVKDLILTYKIHSYPDDLESIDSELQNGDKQEAGYGGSGPEKPISCMAEGFADIINTPIPLWKKTFDITMAGLLVLLLLPVFLGVAVIIKLFSPGPVLYSQMRVGYKGRQFRMWKFRTMKQDSTETVHKEYLAALIGSETPMTKLDSAKDSRIIPGGRVLRATGLDELPQLFNVLRGEMSLVGPRPSLPYEAEQYQPWHHRRFDVLPGLTGLWQVSGKNKTTFLEMIKLDIAYAQQQSPTLDAMIFVKTIPVVLDQVREHFNRRKGGNSRLE